MFGGPQLCYTGFLVHLNVYLETLDSMQMPPLHLPLKKNKIRIEHGSAIHRRANKLKMISWGENKKKKKRKKHIFRENNSILYSIWE